MHQIKKVIYKNSKNNKNINYENYKNYLLSEKKKNIYKFKKSVFFFNSYIIIIQMFLFLFFSDYI